MTLVADQLEEVGSGVARDWSAFKKSFRVIGRMCADVLARPAPEPEPGTTQVRCRFCGLKFGVRIAGRPCEHPLWRRMDYGPYNADDLCGDCGAFKAESDTHWRQEVIAACPRCEQKRAYDVELAQYRRLHPDTGVSSPRRRQY